MSLPKFPDKNKILTLEQAISAIVASIAMEEVALSHVLTAESEKIQYVIECAKTKGCDCTSIKDILAVNKSVADMIRDIAKLQEILKTKLDIALKHVPHPPIPPKPWPPHPPIPPCVSIFTTEGLYTWYCGRSLFLLEDERCNNGVRLIRRDCESLIILPRSKELEIQFELEARSMKACEAVIGLEFRSNNLLVKQERIAAKILKNIVKISQTIKYTTPEDHSENAMVIKLVSPEHLNCVNAKISVRVKKGC